MLDISEPLVQEVAFNWFRTMQKAPDFTEEQVREMASHFIVHLSDVEWEQRIDRGEATLDDWMKADA